MSEPRIVRGKRRFTCLSTGLVRIEFAPDGVFEKRRSMVAYAEQKPLPFDSVEDDGEWLVLKTPRMEIRSRREDDAFYASNLEIRWWRRGLLNYWRPGLRDHRNLGGTVHSLDRFSDYAELGGEVHVADMESPDVKANEWTDGNYAWGAPPYFKMSDAEHLLGDQAVGDNFHARIKFDNDKFLTSTVNLALDQYKYSPGLLSRSGYFFLNDSDSAVMDDDDFPVPRRRPGYQDWYFFAYSSDYRQALRDFRLLSGPAPLPAKNIFGIACCRWPAYDEAEARELIAEFNKHDIPLSGLIIDMEWHKDTWHNWDWNHEMYRDPAAFFAWCHENGIAVSLNVHPQAVRSDDSHFEAFVKATDGEDRIQRNVKEVDGVFDLIEVDAADKKQARAFMEILHDETRDMGLDYWWVDGAKAEIDGSTNEQLVTSKMYFENVETEEKRGMLLSRYGGLGTHRYGVFFTGDTRSQWGVLQRLCEFNIRAGHTGMGYISHDTGGFAHPKAPLIDPILYIRWLQFGVFNPVLRFHSAPGCGSRHPWDYGAENMSIAKHWLQLRNSLIPTLYAAAREHYESGLPIVRGLFLDEPDDDESYRFDQFMFGDSLLVAPILSHREDRSVYFPAGDWFEFETNRRIVGGRERTVNCQTLMDYPVYVRAGSLVVRQDSGVSRPTAPIVRHPVLDIYSGGDATAVLYEDDGQSHGYEADDYLKTIFQMRSDKHGFTVSARTEGGLPIPKRETFTLTMSLDKLPAEIKVNHRPVHLTDEAFDNENGRLRVKAQVEKIDADFELSVRF